MDILVKNGRVVDGFKEFTGDVYIKGGKIEDFGTNLNYNCKKIDAGDLCVMPSFVDMHDHFRDPGFTFKEDIYTGSKSALRGGYTFVNLMGNTNPVCSNMEIVDYVLNKSKKFDLVDVHQVVSITKNFDGETLEHLDTLDKRVKFISDDGKGVVRNDIMYKAFLKAKEKGLVIISHAEDENLTPMDNRLSENLMTIRDISLAKFSGGRLHLAHVSTKEALEEIIKAKKEGVGVTCEVTPHHLALYDNDYKVNPPIREKEDADNLICGLKNGGIDAIATDHAPHSKEDKINGACGISGLESAFSVCYTVLVKRGYIKLSQLSRLMSFRPGELMGIRKGKIEVGYDGDLVLVDLNKKRRIDGSKFLSKGKNTPFDGMEFYGDVIGTVKNGEIKYDGGLTIDY
ncbi:dihydroorotase [Sporanaerobacter sp. PP17-6a]|uniref:dihydroorotase n=1 Tax=Sporanaerobacter sp. PP17-6a TaxID=1891289 RepID=UPI0008A0666B|nr:dihydroorotase [Sporanaerobacter sp. PP17-6a]SCL97126.1 Dihydroorotase [Sporanaerobacter sp. PP17-6a]